MTSGHRAALGAIVAAFALLFFAEGAALPTAWLQPDEAAALLQARGGGSAHAAHGILSAAVLAPAARSLSPSGAYGFARALAALLCALAAIPAYLLARRLLAPGASLVVAVLVLAAPGSVYATAAAPDTLALLLALWSLVLVLRAAERRSGRELAGALALAAAAALARPWFVVLPPALLVAHELIRDDGRPFLRWPRSLVFAGYAVLAYVLLVRTAPEVGNALTRPGATGRAAAASLAVVVVGTGVVPWLAAGAGARRASARPEATLLATCLVALGLAAGVFGAAEGGLDERPLLVLVPLVLAFAASAWLAGGVRFRSAAAAGAVVALAALALPSLGRVASAHAAGLGLVAPNGASRWVLAAGVAAAVAVGLLVVGVLGRWTYAVPAAVALALIGGQAEAWSSARAEARAAAAADPVRHGWIDRRAGPGGHVFAVGPAGAFGAGAVAELTVWNRALRGSRVLDPAGVDPRTGVFPVSDTPLVLARGVELAGTGIARSAAGELLRPTLPLQLTRTVEGVYPDGWSGPAATYRRFSGPQRPGTVAVRVSRADWAGPDTPSKVTFRAGPLDGKLAEVPGPRFHPTIHSVQAFTRVIAVPSPPFQVVVTVDPTFSPARFGGSDSRQLGAKVGFAYRPAR